MLINITQHGCSNISDSFLTKATAEIHWHSNFLLSGYALFSSLATFCWNFFMSKSLTGLSSSKDPWGSLTISLDTAFSLSGILTKTFALAILLIKMLPLSSIFILQPCDRIQFNLKSQTPTSLSCILHGLERASKWIWIFVLLLFDWSSFTMQYGDISICGDLWVLQGEHWMNLILQRRPRRCFRTPQLNFQRGNWVFTSPV